MLRLQAVRSLGVDRLAIEPDLVIGPGPRGQVGGQDGGRFLELLRERRRGGEGPGRP